MPKEKNRSRYKAAISRYENLVSKFGHLSEILEPPALAPAERPVLLDRRVVIGGLLCALCLVGCRAGEEGQGRNINLGPVTAIKPGLNSYTLERILVVRDNGGLAAVSLVCTHQPCLLTPLNSSPGQLAGFTCPCHGAKFDQCGAVLNGPATKPLAWYELSVLTENVLTENVRTENEGSDSSSDELVVHLNKLVTCDWRLRLPLR